MPTVTEAEFWKRVGQILTTGRADQSFFGVKNATGIDTKTLQSIEAGRPGIVEKLSLYARFLGFDLVDLFRSVLSEGTLKPDAVEIQRLFATLSDESRESLLAVTRVMARQQAEGPPAGTGRRLEHRPRAR